MKKKKNYNIKQIRVCLHRDNIFEQNVMRLRYEIHFDRFDYYLRMRRIENVWFDHDRCYFMCYYNN